MDTDFFSFFKKKTVITLGAMITGGFFMAVVKDKSQCPKFNAKIKAKDKVIIVTGANTGIGLETARELAKRGAHVYMACRNMRKCENTRKEIIAEMKNEHVYCRQCDLSSMDSIREFVKQFKTEQQRLDVLINNAGVMLCPKSLTKEGIETHLGVNHVGHFLLTNLLLDLLKKSAPSRIVVVSCIDHENGKINTTDLNSEQSYDPEAAYNQSKLANILFARELAKRLNRTGVVVNAVDPGQSDTELIRHIRIYHGFLGLFVWPWIWPFRRTAISGAQSTLYVALEPMMGNKTGLYYSDFKKANVSAGAKDAAMGQWLWKVTEKWTRLSDGV